jgi:hypothetical protein
MVKIDTDELISIKTASELRQVSISAISLAVKRGVFTVVEIDGVKFLKRDDVLNYEKSKGGRPKKDNKE